MPDTEPIEINPETTDNAAMMRKFRRWWRKDCGHTSKWREEAREDYAFVAGDQWTSEDIAHLKAQLRPAITFDRIDPIIRSVVGEQINNAQEVRYFPREAGDAKANELLTAAATWFRDQCDADDEESDAFWDNTICGVGCTDTRLDMDENPEEPMPVIERIDPLETCWDADARKRNLMDARRLWRGGTRAGDGARSMFPDAADSDLDASWARLNEEQGKIENSDPLDRYNEPTHGEADGDKQVTIAQIQWWEREPYYKVAIPTELAAIIDGVGQDGTIEIPEKDYKTVSKKLKALAGGTSLEAVKLERRVYRQAFLGRTVLKLGKPPVEGDFTLKLMTGFRDRNAGTFYGLVRAMKAPQRWANKWMSQTLHIMNTTAKGGIVAEEDITDDWPKFKKSWAKSEEVTQVRPGALRDGSIQPKNAATFPAGFYQMMTFAISSVRDVSGVSLEMLGQREADQPASLEYQRRQAGMTILAQLFRSMRRYHRAQGKILLYYIQNYLSDNRLIRIVGEEGAKYVPLVRQADVRYDIVVDEGPSSPNQKERVWALIGDRFWTLPPEIQLTLLEYSPFPESVVTKIKQSAQQLGEGPKAQAAERMMMLEAQLKEIDVQLETAKVEKTKAETAKIASSVGQEGKPDDGMAKMAVHVQGQREALVVDLQKHRERLANELTIAREKMAGGVAARTGASVAVIAGNGASPPMQSMMPAQAQPMMNGGADPALAQIGQ